MTGPVWHRTAAAAAVLVLGSVTACSAAQPDLADGAAAKLQSRAVAIRTAAADGNYRAALRALDGLAGELTRAAGQGDVSFPRYQSIDAALGQLRADLTAASEAASPSPAPSATRRAPAATTAPAGQNPAPAAPAVPAVPAQPAAPAPAEPKKQQKAGKAAKPDNGTSNGKAGNGKDPGKANNGKGPGKANGPGKGK